jgi:hypothetical protein
MRAGLSDVLDLDWLGMFDHRELQILVSGADADVDIADMRNFVVVANLQSTVYSSFLTELIAIECRSSRKNHIHGTKLFSLLKYY